MDYAFYWANKKGSLKRFLSSYGPRNRANKLWYACVLVGDAGWLKKSISRVKGPDTVLLLYNFTKQEMNKSLNLLITIFAFTLAYLFYLCLVYEDEIIDLRNENKAINEALWELEFMQEQILEELDELKHINDI